MGFFSPIVEAFRGKPRSKDYGIPLESPRRAQGTNSRQHGRHESRTANREQVTEYGSNNASNRRKSMSRRRSWFGGKPDADEDVPAMPTLVRTDYNHNGGITSPSLGRSSRKNGEDYVKLPEDRRERKSYATRQSATAVGALPPMPTTASHGTTPATSTLPAEQRRSRRQSLSKSLHRSNSQASTKLKRKSRSFWASSNPDDSDEESVPPIPALYSGASPISVRNDPFDDEQPTRGRSTTHGEKGVKAPRPVSTASRKSYTPRSAASGFLKSTNGASEGQRKSYRRSFNLGEGVELVCVTDEHRVEWEKLMNKHSKLDVSVFADANNKDEDEEERGENQGKNKFSNAQALAALEFGVRT